MMSLGKLPGVAEVAMQSGLYAGHRIRRRVSGDLADKPFRYRDLGSAAYISRGRAVVSAGPLQVGGFLGWWIWLFIHIAFLTGYRNRVGVLLTWWLAFTRDVRRERTFTTQQIETLRDVYALPLGPEQPAVAKAQDSLADRASVKVDEDHVLEHDHQQPQRGGDRRDDK